MHQLNHPPPPDPAEVWDNLLAAAMAQPNGPPPSPKKSLCSKLALQRQPGPPKVLPRTRRSLTGIDPPLREAIRALVGGQIPWPLFLQGPAGCGKTCACLCLLDHAGGEYWTTVSWCEQLNDAAFGRLIARGEGGSVTVWPTQLWAKVQRAPLVVLDELGTRDIVTAAHYDAVKRVIDEREGMPLVVISNLDLERVGKLYDDRIVSRLGAGTIVELRGRDRRIEG